MFILCFQVLNQCMSGRERYGFHFPINQDFHLNIEKSGYQPLQSLAFHSTLENFHVLVYLHNQE
jgi:hypothetical protein